MEIQGIKQRFGIIGNYSGLNRAIDIARQVAPTDLSVLITGPSGSGKEIFPQIMGEIRGIVHNGYIKDIGKIKFCKEFEQDIIEGKIK